MVAVPRRLKRTEVYCPEYETTATIRVNDAHSSGTDHLEVDYRSPDHSHFTIVTIGPIRVCWSYFFYHPAIRENVIGRLGKFPRTTSCRSGCSDSGKARRSQTNEFLFRLLRFPRNSALALGLPKKIALFSLRQRLGGLTDVFDEELRSGTESAFF